MTEADKLNAALASQIQATDKVNQNVQDLLDALKADWERRLWLPYSTGATVVEKVIARRPIIVRTLIIYNKSTASEWFVQAHNSVSHIPDGRIPDLPPLPVLPLSAAAFDLPEDGILFSTGLYICGSSTDIQKTVITSADLFIYAIYRFA